MALSDSPLSGHQRRLLPNNHDQNFVYVALGDSTVYGVGATRPAYSYVGRLSTRLREVYPNIRTVNVGVNGATAMNVVVEQLDRAIKERPTLVTLSVGPNDITQGRNPEAYERDITTIFRRLSKETEAVTVANLLPDLSVVPQLPQEMRLFVRMITERFNESLQRAADALGIITVDLFVPSQEQVPGNVNLLAADYYHPSDEGYARWAEVMWRGIIQTLP